MLRQLTALALATSGFVLVATQPVRALVATCDGETATIIDPSPGADDITGTPGRDVIVSTGGDTIHAGGGNDLVCVSSVGVEHAEVFLEAGADTARVTGSSFVGVVGADGNDVLTTSSSALTLLYGGPGLDRVRSWGGPAGLYGGAGNDVLRGGPGGDLLSGNGGADLLVADGTGEDRVLAGPGNDRVVAGGDVTDEVDLGAGDDVLTGSNAHLKYAVQHGVVVNLALGRATGQGTDRVSGVVELSGTSYGDRLLGSSRPEVINGGPGNDRIEARGGADTINPGDGADVVLAGPGADKGYFVHDSVWLGAGADDANTVGRTLVHGGDGNDSILAIQPRTGALVGGGAGVDRVTFDVSPPPDTMFGVRVNLTTGRAVIADWVFEVTGIEWVTGTEWNDMIIGNGLANVLNGLAGNDTIQGRGGIDTADGGDGVDSCTAETEIDCE